MPGWIIQGVRGEGKSLAAVGKIKEYMLRGCPVATNLTLYLDKFLPDDNDVISYRLPDHPRLEDFQCLPPAYDPKYKGEDKNGLLVLDELGTWLNARNWNDKKRLEVLNWLFLSRKDHWDVILLAQDFEMIDSQVRTTLCDFLVQASRLDRQKVPYLSGILKFLGFSGKMARIHNYHIFYGMSTNQVPQEKWTFTGKDFYDGYDTNQKFLNGQEALNGTLVDMRATYSFIPVNYLTRRIFVDRLNLKIEHLRKLPGEVLQPMAKKAASAEVGYLKIGFLVFALLAFLAWRFFSGGFGLPAKSAALVPVSSSVPVPVPASVSAVVPVVSVPALAPVADVFVAVQTNDFMMTLLKMYRPRLSVTAYSPEIGIVGTVDFYDNNNLIETYSVKELHALGVTLLRKPYGIDLIYNKKSFIVTAWRIPDDPVSVVKDLKKLDLLPESLTVSQNVN